MRYVDDPLAAIMGTDEDRELFTAIIILVWEALGFQLAYSKGQQGHNVTWIGGTLTVEAEGVRAKVKQSIIDDICEDIARLTKQNITTLTELHSLVGKLNHAAGLIIYIRPYLEPLWGALQRRRLGSPSEHDLDQANYYLPYLVSSFVHQGHARGTFLSP